MLKGGRSCDYECTLYAKNLTHFLGKATYQEELNKLFHDKSQMHSSLEYAV